MTARVLWSAFALCWVLLWAGAAHAFSRGEQAAFAHAVQSELHGMQGAALTVAIWREGHAWSAAYGHADIEAGRAATVETTFRLASITKAITAAAILRLHEQGKLELDADIRRYVPDYPAQPWVVTPRLLLAHLSGVPGYQSLRDAQDLGPHDSKKALGLISSRGAVAAPGMEFIYSTWAYTLLASAIENLTGTPFRVHLRQAIFDPARMRHADLDDAASRPKGHAKGYRLLRDGKRAPSRPLDVSSRYAGGGGRGSVEDVRAFGVALLEHTLLTKDTTREMMTPLHTKDGKLTDYGLGIAAYPQRGHFLTAHSGGQPETTGLLVVMPADGIVIALLSNLEGQAARLRQLSIRLLELMLEDGQVRREPYADDPVDAVQFEALFRVFSYGLGYREWHTRGAGGPLRIDARARHRAFEALRALVDRPGIAAHPFAALEKVRQAHEPRGYRATLIAGLHMAQALAEAKGEDDLHAYNVAGPIAFFRDFAALEGAADLLGPGILAALERFEGAWTKAQLPQLARARVYELEDPEALWPALLQPLAGGLPLRLNLFDELEALAQRLEAAGQGEQAALWRQRSQLLHPRGPEVVPPPTDPALPAR